MTEYEYLLRSIDLKISALSEMLDKKISMLMKIDALDAVKGRPLNEQIHLLNSIGMSPTEIASCLGKTPNTIRVLLHRVKKESTSNKLKNKKDEDE